MSSLPLEPYAARLRWRFARPLTGSAWGALFAEHIQVLAARSAEIAASVVGHIKGLAIAPDDGYVRVNLVSPSVPADVECKIHGQHAALTFDLNVLIFGLPAEQVKRLTADAAESVASRLGGQVDIESINF
jgi:hypothetical protein